MQHSKNNEGAEMESKLIEQITEACKVEWGKLSSEQKERFNFNEEI